MTEHDLSTLLRDHVREQEPAFQLSPDRSIALGRRTLLRRRARRGLVGVAVAAAAVVAVPLLPWGGSSGADHTDVDRATASVLAHYDALRMPDLIEQHVGTALGDGLTGLGPAAFRAGDDQGTALPPRYYDKASSMEVSYGGQGDRQVRVALMHSRGEAEGDAAKSCEQDVADGYAFSCDVTTAASGDVVTTKVMALRKEDGNRGWGAVTRDELRTGVPVPTDPSQQPIDPDQVFFMRVAESVHSDTFLTTASETVRAPDLATARLRWAIPATALARVVTDPELVIPKPPRGDNGCAWMLHPEGISCHVQAP